MGKPMAHVTYTQAREIMGKNYFGIEEGIKHFGITPTREQRSTLQNTPFTFDRLEKCKDTHMLTAVFPVHILAIQERVNRSLFRKQNDAWYAKEKLATYTGNVAWYLLDMFNNKTLDQVIHTRDKTRYPAQIHIYATIGHVLNTGERVYRTIYVPCSDTPSAGPEKRVYVGFFHESYGLDILFL